MSDADKTQGTHSQLKDLSAFARDVAVSSNLQPSQRSIELSPASEANWVPVQVGQRNVTVRLNLVTRTPCRGVDRFSLR